MRLGLRTQSQHTGAVARPLGRNPYVEAMKGEGPTPNPGCRAGGGIARPAGPTPGAWDKEGIVPGPNSGVWGSTWPMDQPHTKHLACRTKMLSITGLEGSVVTSAM